MAITQKICNSTLGVTGHVLEATTSLAVTSMHLCNITSTDSTVNVYILPSDGSTTAPSENNKIYNAVTIKATDTYIVDTEKMIMSNGDKLFVQNADSTGQVTVTLSTIGL